MQPGAAELRVKVHSPTPGASLSDATGGVRIILTLEHGRICEQTGGCEWLACISLQDYHLAHCIRTTTATAPTLPGEKATRRVAFMAQVNTTLWQLASGQHTLHVQAYAPHRGYRHGAERGAMGLHVVARVLGHA